MSVFSRGRRLILSTLLGLLGLITLGKGWLYLGKRLNVRHKDRPLDIDNDFKQFLLISSLLLEIPVVELNADFGKKIWLELTRKREVQKPLTELLDAPLFANEPKSIPPQIFKEDFWFRGDSDLSKPNIEMAKTIVSAWYTGVIEWNSQEKIRIGYEESLMFSMFSNQRPIPGNCYGSYGYWAEPPALTAKNTYHKGTHDV